MRNWRWAARGDKCSGGVPLPPRALGEGEDKFGGGSLRPPRELGRGRMPAVFIGFGGHRPPLQVGERRSARALWKMLTTIQRSSLPCFSAAYVRAYPRNAAALRGCRL